MGSVQIESATTFYLERGEAKRENNKKKRKKKIIYSRRSNNRASFSDQSKSLFGVNLILKFRGKKKPEKKI